MKNDFFKLKDHGTTVRREVLAGITTFMTMAYVLAVQPSAICGFGPDPYITDINGVVISKSALLVMCALVSGIITLFMGLYANLPLALSTAMVIRASSTAGWVKSPKARPLSLKAARPVFLKPR